MLKDNFNVDDKMNKYIFLQFSAVDKANLVLLFLNKELVLYLKFIKNLLFKNSVLIICSWNR